MVDINCLYLRNLPRRPRSKSNYTRLLLRHINSTNRYAKDSSLPLPNNETVGNAKLELLDAENSVVSISLSRSTALQNQCFITFTDAEQALKFKQKFDSKLKINGRFIDIQFARKNSLLGLSIIDSNLLYKALKTKRLKQRIQRDDSSRLNHKLKRKLRRLRNKLRTKGIPDDEIQNIIDSMVSENLAKVVEENKSKKDTSNKQKPKITTIKENPPNKVLLVQNLPSETSLETITPLFKSDALVEIRLVGVRNLAFVEYQSTEAASEVRTVLGSLYDWDGHQISVEFAK